VRNETQSDAAHLFRLTLTRSFPLGFILVTFARLCVKAVDAGSKCRLDPASYLHSPCDVTQRHVSQRFYSSLLV